jgi:subtilase family serine protease
VVRFRWLDAAGATVERARAVSRACRQPDPRPDLAVVAITELTTGRYALLIRNDGRTASEATAVTLSVDGAVLPEAAVPALESGEEALVGVEGPACAPGGVVAAEVDPADAVAERTEGDNRFSRSC